MSLPSFTTLTPLSPQPKSLCADLSDSESRHVRAARIRPGEHIVLRDAEGRGIECVFLKIADNTLTFESCRELEPDKTLDFTLVCAVSKGDRMTLTLRCATELGVRNIIPVTTRRCVVRLDDASKTQNKLRHWSAVIQSAVQQSGRILGPALGDVCALSQILSLVESYDLFLVAYEEAREGDIERGIRKRAEELSVQPQQLRVALLIGPEGGLESQEVCALEEHGAKTVTLGNTILRCETACIVGSALALHAMAGC